MKLYKWWWAQGALALATGCGGAPFELVSAQDAGHLAHIEGPDTGSVVDAQAAPDSDVVVDSGRDAVGAQGADAAWDTGNVVVDSGAWTKEASVVDSGPDVQDAGPDAGPDGGADAGQCTPIPPGTFGCGPPIIVDRPGQFCVLTAPGAPTPAVAVTMPAACQCAETYSCECLGAMVRVLSLCQYGLYQSCSVGTTGGVVVVCR